MKNNSKFSDGDAGAGGRGKQNLDSREMTTLGALCVFKGGDGFKEIYQGQLRGEYPFIKVSDMNLQGNEKFIMYSKNWVSKKTLDILRATLQPTHATVFAKVGAALKLNRRRILKRSTVIDNNMMSAIPNEKKISYLYLFYFLQTQDLAKFTQYGAVPSINQKHLCSIPIYLPKLKIQHKIANILELWDTAIEKTERLIAAKEKHFKWLLKTLISDQQNKKSYSTSLENLTYSEIVIEKGKPIKYTETTKGKIPVIAGGKTSPYTHNKYTHNFPCITVSSSGAYAGYIWLHTNSIWASDCIVIYSKEGSTDYLYYALKLQQQKIYAMKIGSGQPHVYPKDLKKITIPLPSIQRQKQITHTLNTAKQEITTLQNLAEKYRTQKRGLMQKLLKGA